MPEISVIIPTHDRLEFLQKAVESVMDQTFSDFELLIIDDGSTDGTFEKFSGSNYPIKYHYQPRMGVSTARNRGIQLSSGNLIAFLDSDDLWKPEKLFVQKEFFDKNPDILICQTEEIWIRNGKRVNPKNKHTKPTGYIFNESLKLCVVSPSSVMMRRELLEITGTFDEKLPSCEDYDLWLRIGYRLDVPLIADPLVIKFGGHSDQLSRMFTGIDRFRIYSLQKLLKENLTSDQNKLTINELKYKCDILKNGALKRGNILLFLKAFLVKYVPENNWGIEKY